MSPEPTRSAMPNEGPQLSALPAPAPAEPEHYLLWTAERSCCCLAKPAVAAVLPPAPGRDHATDLLLCGHHYRACRHALAAAGAAVMDENGQPVGPRDVPLLGAG
jgi:hypothetical protein